MSGDCGHGWGYHSGGPSSPCDKCTENRKAAQRTARKIADAIMADTQKAGVHLSPYEMLNADIRNQWQDLIMKIIYTEPE